MAGAAAGARPLTVLLVEDNATNRRLLAAVLGDLGHQVHAVADGAAAVAAASNDTFDVVLMDVVMPGVDGIEATRRIRALDGRAARIPIVALSANSAPADRRRYLDAGMTDVVAKPLGFDDLARALDRAAAPTTA